MNSIKSYSSILLVSLLFIYAYDVTVAQFRCNPEEDCQGKINKVVPDPKDCQKFYICDMNTGEPGGMSYTCGENYYFDGETDPNQVCVEGTCPTGPICSEKPESKCKISCSVQPDGMIAAASDCGDAFVCVSGVGMFPANCEEGQFFDGEGCVLNKKNACCQSLCTIPSCIHLDDYVFLPDPSDCQNFYLCIGGRSVLQSCKVGESFDIEYNSCLLIGATCGDFCKILPPDEKN